MKRIYTADESQLLAFHELLTNASITSYIMVGGVEIRQIASPFAKARTARRIR